MQEFMNPENYHDLYPQKNPRKLIFTKNNEYTILFLWQFVIKSQKKYLISKKSKLKAIVNKTVSVTVNQKYLYI